MGKQHRLKHRAHQRPSHHEREQRKWRVLTHSTPAIIPSIAEAVVIKDENLFFLTTRDGRVPLRGTHGFGLYYHDCRYLDGYELRLAGVRPGLLVASAARGYMAVVELTNPDLRLRDGSVIHKEKVGLKWERVIDGAQLTLRDRITFQNFGQETAAFPISFDFGSRFEDIFVVRGMLPERCGTVKPPEWNEDTLTLAYCGIDRLNRTTRIRFSQRPRRTHETSAYFKVSLEPGEQTQLELSIALAESEEGGSDSSHDRRERPFADVVSAHVRSSDRWRERHTEVHSDRVLAHRLIERSVGDLKMLQTRIADAEFVAAGVPWFVTLFGRDSVISAFQSLSLDHALAEQTLRVLARFQGTRVDRWREEEPGKVLHELRVGELTRAGVVPYSPYYGTVDATPLFLILLGRHAAWTGTLDLFRELRGNVERALEWIANYGDLDGDGYLEYDSGSGQALINQGWKDSGDAIVNADGTLAEPPIALVEVQGYVYMAKRAIADLFRRDGEPGRAERLEREARELRERFNRDFWLEEKGCYALALQRDKRPAAVISSNPGHALWAGIADDEKARMTAERLMAEDMFSGWGVRTLSARESRYNPIGYHLGTVWPHDNSIIAAGFRRYGFDEAAQRICAAITDAALEFEHFRLPELFAGFSRDEYGVPVNYPVADHPQAWGAGSVPYLLETLLGLVPEAFEHRLRIVRPLLPAFVDWLEIRQLRVGSASVDLRLARAGDEVATEVLRVEGDLDVVTEPNGHITW
jgi:glycogen debranching enzyme